MLFLGWILLAWTSGAAEPPAEGREADRQMDPRARRRHVVGSRRPGHLGLGPRSSGAERQACPHTAPWRTQIMKHVTLPQRPPLVSLLAAEPISWRGRGPRPSWPSRRPCDPGHAAQPPRGKARCDATSC